ncbi:Intradiol ring-cleavage dioxygenase [Pseudomassariella vexata]|uniref:Intradiol ring-cleavage dioxygenase n=1 Tax=Pseudomassariella vexata TaxID=1141098 RepID=A0A1Y2DEM4_9PEZI|nr:Intradiol ring-cleavage dioxygenase [Pseudomassariella vexata]ORY57721.1 Intradiol ring-cleavage dioxygenase [Pseudomassariella vexata]
MSLSSLLSLSPLTAAHHNEKFDKQAHMDELANAHAVAEVNSRALKACQNQPEVQARKDRAIARRAATFDRLRHERGLEEAPFHHRRDNASFQAYASHSHDQTGHLPYTKDTPHSEIFGSNTSCTLTPDNANGPYFVYQEHIRQDVVEGVSGIPMHLELQFIDVTTCKPANVLVDIWSCNATGAYSGVSASSEGGLSTTFLRGVQPTDEDGVVEFDTVFPGHYLGRATHEHIIAHVGSQVLPNRTYSGGRVAHLSQLFFDQGLIDAVERTAPYSANTIPPTSNLEDGYTGYAASPNYDPFPNYVMLGGGLDGGMFVWAELGINTSANWDHYAPYAATWKEGGGYDNPDFDWMAAAFPPATHG